MSGVRITLTPDQRGLIRQATGNHSETWEPVDMGPGLLYAAGGNKLRLLKDAYPEGYRAARRRYQPHIDLRCAKFHPRIGRSRIHRFDVFAEEHIPAHRNVIGSGHMCRRYRSLNSPEVVELHDYNSMGRSSVLSAPIPRSLTRLRAALWRWRLLIANCGTGRRPITPSALTGRSAISPHRNSFSSGIHNKRSECVIHLLDEFTHLPCSGRAL